MSVAILAAMCFFSCDQQKQKNAGSVLVPFNRYTHVTINGHEVYLSPALVKEASLCDDFKRTVDKWTVELSEKLPAKMMREFRSVKIVAELNVTPYKEQPACYLGGIGKRSANELKTAQFVIGNRAVIKEKINCVEVTNTRRLMKDFVHPAVLLHEWAHMHHDLHLGFEDKSVQAAYAQAKERKLYPPESYCMNNEKEYFAEMTVCYFYPGYQTHFPSIRKFKEKDAKGYEMIMKGYGIRDVVP